jgi:glutathione S-transferase
MMRLLSAPASPFARKVRMTARVKGVMDLITVEAADTSVPHNAELSAANPLSKIPVLILADGTHLFDSRVICEYLDTLSRRPVLFPAAGIARYTMLTRAALADGLMDATLLQVYERRYRDADKIVQSWLDRQQHKINLALAHLETSPPSWTGQPDYADITLACALGYLDIRFEGRWRATHPQLVGWLQRVSITVPAFGETAYVG